MAEDTAALVETVKRFLPQYVMVGYTGPSPYAALDALAQRLADAERSARGYEDSLNGCVKKVLAAEARAERAEAALREIADDDTVWAQGIAETALAATPTEEPR